MLWPWRRRPEISEKKIVAVMAAVLMVLVFLPTLAAVLLARARGLAWSGRTIFSPDDLTVYLSYLSQAKNGARLFISNFSAERSSPFLNLLWLAVGLLGRFLHLAPLAAYQLARLLLIPVFAFTVHWATKYFLPTRRERLLATALMLFASGWGVYFVPFLPAQLQASGFLAAPVDLWVAEALGFSSAFYSPHFLASWTLIIVSLVLLFRAFTEDRLRLAAWAGLAALVLFNFHPYHAPTLYAVGAAACLAELARGRKAWRQLLALGVFVAVSAPSVIYEWWLMQPARNGAVLAAGNICLTPPLIYILLGFGALLPLAVAGFFLQRRRSRAENQGGEHLAFLVAWAVIELLIIYAPLAFNRRLLQGWEFPLAVLSATALAAGLDRFDRRSDWRWLRQPALGALLFVVVLAPTSLNTVIRDVVLTARNQPPYYFYSSDQVAAFAWMRVHLHYQDVVLATYMSGNDLGGWANVSVFEGQWTQTVDVVNKNRAAEHFFSAAATDAWRQDLLADSGVDYVYWGPAEKNLGADLRGRPYLQAVYTAGDITVFRVTNK